MTGLKPGERLNRFWRWISPGSLLARIALINILGLAILSAGILYFNQFRQSLINARIESLQIQAQIISAAIAGSAIADTSNIVIDPGKLGDPLNDPIVPSDDTQFEITPDKAGPVMQRLLANTNIRGQIIDADGNLIVDTAFNANGNDIVQNAIGQPAPKSFWRRMFARWSKLTDAFFQQNYPLHVEYQIEGNQKRSEIQTALSGASVSTVRLSQAHEIMVLVTAPIQRFRAVQGTLVLHTQGNEIDQVLAAERWVVLNTTVFTAFVTLLLSALITSTIARPIRRLSAAADRVRRGINHSRVEIPDFTHRSDEIGQLSGAMSHMTKALYNRIAAIETFAADVAHELKNPLTSMRSAVETFRYAKTDDQREKLIKIVVHDVQRMDRLISDISDASRLDAELARTEAQPLDFGKLVENICAHANDTAKPDMAPVKFTAPKDDLMVLGHDSRLGQVLRNLIDNARSFTKPGTSLNVTMRRMGNEIEASVDDEGPGISPENLERVFERFYTDRPEQSFGGNSGLGLAISRQVIEAHKGRIWAENIEGPKGKDGETPIRGARFILRLPALPAGWKAEA